LQDLERADAFVTSLDAARTWFRCHQVFADLLLLELRRTTPEEITGLHAAAGWYAAHGYAARAGGPHIGAVPADQCKNFQMMLIVLRLALARQRGDLSAAAKESDQLSATLAQDPGRAWAGNELSALALISVCIVETWSVRIEDADGHLGQGVALARRALSDRLSGWRSWSSPIMRSPPRRGRS
jgi:hypothetical protein